MALPARAAASAGLCRGGGAERHEALDGGGVAVEDGDGKAVADQAGGKVAAEMAKADEGVAFAHGISGVCIICRCRSLPVIGMRLADRLVELDAEAGLLRRDDVAVLPLDLLLQQRGVETVPLLQRFQDEEVGQRHRELDVGGADDRPAIAVRRDLDVVGLGHGGDLLGFENAAGAAEVGLQDGRGAVLDDAGEFELGRQPLAGGDRDRGAARHLRHHFGHVRRHRLLEPQRIVGLDGARHAQRARRGELAVRAEQDVGAGADRLADRLDHAGGEVDVDEARLVAVEGGVGTGRVELDGVETLLDIFERAGGGEVGIVVDVLAAGASSEWTLPVCG